VPSTTRSHRRETAIITIAHPKRPHITVGVDTHLDVHVAHAKNELGRRLATVSIPTTPDGYRDLLAWAQGLGEVDAWGVEGTGCYGAALARFLCDHGQVVLGLEVNRPDRQARRRRGKSDPLDAEAAARAVQAGEVATVPKAGNATVEMIRSLRVARQTAVKARTQAINALKALLVTAPVDLRERLRGRSATTLVRQAAALQPGMLDTPTAAAKLALRCLAERDQVLSAEIATLDTELDRLVAKAAPGLLARFGVGPKSAGALLGTTPTGCAQRPASRCCAGPPRSRHPRARPSATASTAAATATPTPRCTRLWSCGCAGTSRPVTTWHGGSSKASPGRRSSVA
jgi:transposase